MKKFYNVIVTIAKWLMQIFVLLIPNVIISVFLLQFGYGLLVSNAKDNLNMILVILFALATILFTWATCVDEKNKKDKLLNFARNTFHAAIYFTILGCLLLVETKQNEISKASNYDILKIAFHLESISKAIVISLGIGKAIYSLTGLNIYLYRTLHLFDDNMIQNSQETK